MKNSGFKRKTYKEVLSAKKSIKAPVKSKSGKLDTKKPVKKKVITVTKLHKQVWAITREIIIGLYGNTCYSSKQNNLEGSNLHCGHLLAKATLPISYKYDLRLLRPQSYNANINKGGDFANYLENWLLENNVTYEEYEAFRKEIRTAPLVNSKDYLLDRIAWLKDVKEVCEKSEWDEWCKDAYTRLVPELK